MIRSEGQTVTEQHPLNADDAHDHEALHEDGQNVLASDQAAVEEREARRHQQDQSAVLMSTQEVSPVSMTVIQTPSAPLVTRPPN